MTTAQVDPFSADAAAAAAQFLGGSSVVAAKFPRDGFVVEGTILSFRMSQQSDINSGELLFWENKKQTKQSELRFPQTAQPCSQLVIELQGEPTGVTWEGLQYDEVQVEDDDGIRALYVKGRMQKAVAQALKDAGVKAPEEGGYLKVARTGTAKASGGVGKAFTYAAQYTPASKNSKAAGQFLAAGEEGGVPDPFGGQPAGPNPFGN